MTVTTPGRARAATNGSIAPVLHRAPHRMLMVPALLTGESGVVLVLSAAPPPAAPVPATCPARRCAARPARHEASHQSLYICRMCNALRHNAETSFVQVERRSEDRVDFICVDLATLYWTKDHHISHILYN